MLLFTRVLRWYPLKPMQIQTSPKTRSLKPIQIASTNEQKAQLIMTTNQLKPMRTAPTIAQKEFRNKRGS